VTETADVTSCGLPAARTSASVPVSRCVVVIVLPASVLPSDRHDGLCSMARGERGVEELFTSMWVGGEDR